MRKSFLFGFQGEMPSEQGEQLKYREAWLHPWISVQLRDPEAITALPFSLKNTCFLLPLVQTRYFLLGPAIHL